MRNGLPPRSPGRRVTAWLGAVTLVSAMALADAGMAVSAPNGPAAERAPTAKGPIGWETYRQLDGLAQTKPNEQTKQFSSFDRTGGNDDGFEGTHSCLRQSDRGCVIAEHAGAGEISSMWFTRDYGDMTQTGNIIVELDGKTVLDAPLQDVVQGKVGAPFEWPLVGNGDDTAGGAVIKVPMPYRESMRVTVQNNPLFYHVSHRTFADASGVSTFDPSDPATDVLERLRRFGVADPKPQREGKTTGTDLNLAPGEAAQVASPQDSGMINQLRVRIPQIVASPRVPDDGRAFGAGGGSEFDAAVAPNNEGVRIIKRYDPKVADQVANLSVDGQPAGQWRSAPAEPDQWGVQSIDVPSGHTAGKSSIHIANQFVSSSLDVNEFRYDIQSKVNGDWVRTDVLDLGGGHPGEERAHNYQIHNQMWQGRWTFRYPTDPQKVADSDKLMEGVRLKVSFDGKETVNAPIGEFFGSGLGEYDVRNLMSSIDPGPNGWYTSWWPMPFAGNAKVEIVNDSGIPIQGGNADVSTVSDSSVAQGLRNGELGYFNANHRRGTTQPGQDWKFLQAQGSGVFRGVTHSMRGLIPPGAAPRSNQPTSRSAAVNQRIYLEGDERVYVNGSNSPALHGTGSEDFYQSGWYFRDGATFSMPEAGNPNHEVSGDGCQYDCTGAYRLMIGDGVPYSNGIDFGIEHGPQNDAPGDYSSTAYWYSQPEPGQVRTDMIDTGDDANRAAHNYQAQGETRGQLTSTYEGLREPNEVTRPTTSSTGEVTFNAALTPDNQGLRIRRMSDQEKAYQRVAVFIDGQFAGNWQQPLGNTTHRWLKDVFDVAPELTSGKSNVQVRLVPAQGSPPWSASTYEVFSR